ncbi:MAG TPA: SlyX family protein [Candidatus Ozemobacteraceae bacterium]|nr:SlyX family protein [Candidatus Ozemobacteraceae bacterium]
MKRHVEEASPALTPADLEEMLTDAEYRLAQLESRYEQLANFVEQLNDVVVAQDRRIMGLERELAQQRENQQGSSGLGALSGIRSDKPTT